MLVAQIEEEEENACSTDGGRRRGCTHQVLAALLTVLKGAKAVVGGQGRYRNGPDALSHWNGLHGVCSYILL